MEREVLRSPDAGGKVVRGGVLRAVGYGVGFVVGAGTSVLLLRHLGPVEFGRFVIVTSLMGIVSGVTDAGLTTVGARELALRSGGEERDGLLANLVALRLLVTPLGVLAAVAFGIVVGYDATLVLGTLVAGLGLVLVNAQATMMLPLSVELRIGRVTAVEIVKHVVLLVGVAVLVAVGSELLPFFAVQVVTGAVVLALTPFLVGLGRMRPAIDRATARLLLREALPIAVALAMNVIYLRVLVILMSLIASDLETGYFGTSFRIFEVLFGIPTLVLGVALPVLAVAGHEDDVRLRYALQRMSEVALVVGAGIVLVVAIAAEPAIVLLGGEEYREAAPVLRIQAVALLWVFLGQTWQLGLVAIRQQRALAVANAFALLVVVALGLALIPVAAAQGAAIAAVVAEASLALGLLAFLRRTGRDLVPRGGFAWRVGACAALAGAVVLVPGLPTLAAGALAGLLYAAGVVVTRALPREVIDAFSRLPARPESQP